MKFPYRAKFPVATLSFICPEKKSRQIKGKCTGNPALYCTSGFVRPGT